MSSQDDDVGYLCIYLNNKQDKEKCRVSVMMCLFVYINCLTNRRTSHTISIHSRRRLQRQQNKNG
jgi:hypothetical protein